MIAVNDLYVSTIDTKHRKVGDIIQPLYIGRAIWGADTKEIGYVYINNGKKNFALVPLDKLEKTVRQLTDEERSRLLKSRNITNVCLLPQ